MPDLSVGTSPEVESQREYRGPSVVGFALTILIALGLYFAMTHLPKLNLDFLSYSVVAENAPHNMFYRMIWFVQDFTNAQFFASFFAGIGLLLGAVVAYYFSIKRSSRAVSPFPTLWEFGPGYS